MLPISLCIIMKNEEKHLESCLDSLISYGFELILIDTGSTDSTVKIASAYTNTICHFDWINDFSAARNYSLSLASNDWVLVLDCDEAITALDVSSLLCFMKDHPQDIGLLSRRNHYEMNGTDSVYVDQVERFFNRKLFHYEGKVHEQVTPLPGARSNHVCLPIKLEVEHNGYMGTPEELEAKSMRNLRLLEEMLEQTPDQPYLYFQIGQCYNMLHDDERAAYYYSKGLSFDVNPELEYVQMMVIGYGYALLHLNRLDEALGLQGVYDAFSTSADFICLMGLIHLRSGNLISAMAQFLKAIACPVAHVEGANSFIPYYNMGCINELLGDRDTALTLYRKCGDFPMALAKIEELQK